MAIGTNGYKITAWINYVFLSLLGQGNSVMNMNEPFANRTKFVFKVKATDFT